MGGGGVNALRHDDDGEMGEGDKGDDSGVNGLLLLLRENHGSLARRMLRRRRAAANEASLNTTKSLT